MFSNRQEGPAAVATTLDMHYKQMHVPCLLTLHPFRRVKVLRLLMLRIATVTNNTRK